MTDIDHDQDPSAARLAEVEMDETSGHEAAADDEGVFAVEDEALSQPEADEALESDDEGDVDGDEDTDPEADPDHEQPDHEQDVSDDEEGIADEDAAEMAQADEEAESHRQIAAAMSPADRVRMVEAILFASAEPVGGDELKSRLPDDSDLDAIVTELQALYEPRGVNLVKVAGKWAFRTAPDMSFLLQKEKVEPRKLSRAAIETLAIIAYHQPVTRAEIEELRGVTVSKGTLDVLLDVGWVRMRGRKPVPGRPLTYGTSEDFLEHFGLASVGDLPGMEDLKSAGLLDWRLPPDFSVPVPLGDGDGDGDGDFDEEEPELDLEAAAEAAAMSEDELFEIEEDDADPKTSLESGPEDDNDSVAYDEADDGDVEDDDLDDDDLDDDDLDNDEFDDGLDEELADDELDDDDLDDELDDSEIDR